MRYWSTKKRWVTLVDKIIAWDIDGIMTKKGLSIDKAITPDQAKEWILENKIITEFSELANSLKKMGYSQYAITGRKFSDSGQLTIQQFKLAHVEFIKIYFYPDNLDHNRRDYTNFKKEVLEKIYKSNRGCELNFVDDDEVLVVSLQLRMDDLGIPCNMFTSLREFKEKKKL